MESTLYNIQAKETGKIEIPESIFGVPWNADLVHQVVVSMQGNARPNVADTKGRGEVRGGGKKPWKQKGTGRARHGSSRSPIWKGGGVTHGPTSSKIYTRKINRTMSQKALLAVLSRKHKEGEVIFVDSIELQAPKASAARAMLAAFAKHFSGLSKKKNAALIALPVRHVPTMKSFQNFGNIAVEEVRNLNPLSVLSAKYLILASPKDAFELFDKKAASIPAPSSAPKAPKK
ncbi:50S ribosomal protein L4 [Candidatus Adlerbacteria bacterium RIFCSPHIGHO2_02_FULL_54_18]|uniref:Large ribosomal subunit protein uL4 n=1 Tax=Candidatus Adlerbacteria bacterium RIFCSPHIGHO2_02_FULL_54_18 TaxID=1797241 RepID=A0A1F4Y331_9BACT|nr:MAG: 50S ribosomal protein L4 [Candidatus Adlerbacteria bacterium RIFCSPHIGHO2_02_FULL_54_18]